MKTSANLYTLYTFENAVFQQMWNPYFSYTFDWNFAGEAISAGWCIWNRGWETERMLWCGKHEKNSHSCYKICGERCFAEAIHCRGPFWAQRSLQHSAFLSHFFGTHELTYIQIWEVELFPFATIRSCSFLITEHAKKGLIIFIEHFYIYTSL